MKMNGLDHARRLLHIFLISITIESSYFKKQLKEQKIGKLCFSSWTIAFSLLDIWTYWVFFLLQTALLNYPIWFVSALPSINR